MDGQFAVGKGNMRGGQSGRSGTRWGRGEGGGGGARTPATSNANTREQNVDQRGTSNRDGTGSHGRGSGGRGRASTPGSFTSITTGQRQQNVDQRWTTNRSGTGGHVYEDRSGRGGGRSGRRGGHVPDSGGRGGGEAGGWRLRQPLTGTTCGREEPRRSGRTTRTKSIRPVGNKELNDILNKDARVLLLTIQDPNFGFNELLKVGKFSCDTLFNIISVISKASGCTGCPQNVLRLLNDVLSLNIFTIHVPRYLEAASHSEDEISRLPTAIERLVFLFDNMLQSLPNKASETLGIALVTICDVVTRFEDDGKPLDAFLSQRVTFLDRLRGENLAKYDAVTRNKLTREEAEAARISPDDFRSMSIFPTVADVHEILHPFLRSNIVYGKYKDVDHYLDVHFRLMREDFVAPLRDGLTKYLALVKCGRVKDLNQKDIKIYFDVRIVDEEFSYNDGVLHELKFSVTKLKFVRWENTRRLMYGSLICLSSDNFQTFTHGIIINRDPNKLKHGFLTVRLIGGQNVLSMNKNGVYLMADSPAYFEAYSPILRGLQSLNEDSLPFKRYLIDVETDVRSPRYLRDTSTYDFRCLTNSYRTPLCRVLDVDSWPTADDLSLDNNQYLALKQCLTKEMAIVQGPPGTGKTFLGLKVVKMLLENCDIGSPILIVCYTNHALDQFLEGILCYEKNIVRIGSRSKSETVDRYNLNVLRRQKFRRVPGNLYSNKMDLYSQLKMLRNFISDEKNLLHVMEVEILHESKLKHFMKREHFYQLQDDGDLYFISTFAILDWLGLNGAVVQEVPDVVIRNTDDEEDDRESVAEDALAEEEMEKRYHDEYFVEEILKDDSRQRINYRATRSFKILELPEAKEGGWKVQKWVKKMMKVVNFEMKNTDQMTEEEEDNVFNIFALLPHDRWRLYRLWVSRLRHRRLLSINRKQEEYEMTFQRLRDVLCDMEAALIRGAKVVGMTTTGAAKSRGILQILSPTIVVVEEAAEVLESHIITALTSRCEHLIMIGDQQQLRPNPTVYRLVRDYKMDISLFERLIRNGVPYERLQMQHRMRPRIAELLVPHIYEILLNHPSVEKYKSVRGTVSSLFFINHSHAESTVSDTSSRANVFEATFLIALCRHLLLQGYNHDQITILSTYLGQVFLIKKLLKSANLENVRCTVVDNFQGEENDIILLSFVRSNAEGNVGFLKVENRVCVALSRAKMGLFCIGNFDFLAENAKIWKPIVDSLKRDNLVGPRLELKCENHPEFITKVGCSEDFKLFPEGGCGLPCDYRLACGHQCPKICHNYNVEHQKIQCEKPCEKMVCELQHKCTKCCYMKCGPCMEIVSKMNPLCKHFNDLKCHEDPLKVPCKNPCEKVLCKLQHKCKHFCYFKCKDCLITVSKENPACGHFNDMPCFKDPVSVRCMKPCDKILCKQQHECKKLCYEECGNCMEIVSKENFICGHVNEMACSKDPLTVPCQKPCEKVLCELQHKCPKLCNVECGDCLVVVPKKNSVCGHVNEMSCSEDPLTVPCMSPCDKVLCDLQHKCPLLCYQKCQDCFVWLPKKYPNCGHFNELLCCENPLLVPCKNPCEKLLNCGHPCKNECGELCNNESCNVKVERVAKCGHTVSVECFQSKIEKSLLDACKHPCVEYLMCSHRCTGNCKDCHQGRMHLGCKEKCRRPLLCGHLCKSSCAQYCSLCMKPCENRCDHSHCKLKCGFPCKPCKKPCAWRCEHLACTKLCYEPCDREPCNEPCNVKLPCGHSCIGFCGEPCPKQCRECNKKDYTNLFGHTDDVNARFVLLEDCGHIFEASMMDHYMKQGTLSAGDTEHTVIEMKRCPECRTIIRKSFRYSTVVKQTLADVASIKKEISDDIRTTKVKLTVVKHFLKSTRGIDDKFRDSSSKFIKCTVKLARELQQCQVLSELCNMANLLNILREMIRHQDLTVDHPRCKSAREKVIHLQDWFLELNKHCSYKQVYDLSREFRRALLLSNLILNADRELLNDEAKVLYDNIVLDLTNLNVFTYILENEVNVKLTNMNKLDPNLKIAVSVEKMDLLTILQMGQGVWCKCPNGHIYAVPEYRAIMQEEKEKGRCSKCEDY